MAKTKNANVSDKKEDTRNMDRGAKRRVVNDKVEKKGKYSPSNRKLLADAKNDRTNDPEWYGKIPALLESSANISYLTGIGAPLKVFPELDGDPGLLYSEAGVCAFEFVPTMGRAWDARDPVNIAANKLFAETWRNLNGNTNNYGWTDEWIYLTAIANAYSYIAYLRRIYGVLSLYSQFNHYLPDALLQAMHVNISDVKKHIPDLRFGITQLQYYLNTYTIPGHLTYLTRQIALNSNIYADEESIKAQIYLFVQKGYYKYDQTTEQTGGSLRFVPFTDTDYYTVDSLIDFGMDLIAPLVTSADAARISGDVERAFGSENCFRADELPEDYQVKFGVSGEMLNQIHNMSIIPIVPQPIRQAIGVAPEQTYLYTSYPIDESYGLSDILQLGRSDEVFANHLIDISVDVPNPAFNIVVTRLMANVGLGYTSKDPDADFIPVVTDCGSEIVTAGYIYYRKQMPGFEDVIASLGIPSTYHLVNGSLNRPQASQILSFTRALALTSKLSEFNYHPYIFFLDVGEAGEQVLHLLGFCGEMINPTSVSNETLANMHRTAIMSQMGIGV